MAKIKSTKIRNTFGDNVLNIIIAMILVLLCVIVLYPVIFVVSSSFSSSEAVESGLVILWPVDFSLEAYDFVLAYKQVWVGFRNSIFYTIVCTFMNMASNILVAYPISRKYFKGRTFYTLFIFFTSRIGAGMIPTFVVRTSYGLFDNIWAILLNGWVQVSNILILRTAISSGVSDELFDAARIDGAGHFQSMLTLAIPLTKATIATLMLFAIVTQWNEYFTSMLYLRNSNLYPLQLVLRPIMTAASARGTLETSSMGSAYRDQASQSLENVRYALIVISTVPIAFVYLFCQRFFKAGIMVGSLKG